MQNLQPRSRAGWASEETQMMWDEVRRAGQVGGTLRSAFLAVAEKTGRKPDSIRNFYYQSLKGGDAPEELAEMRAQPFTPFTREETDWMLREILAARAKGISVRACVQQLGNGERALALRYQNKYRSILKNRPDMIEDALRALKDEGVDCPNPYDSLRIRRAQDHAFDRRDNTSEAEHLLSAMREMLSRQGHEEDMRHREELDRMSVRCDLLRLELARRDEALLATREREGRYANALRKASGLAETCDELLSQAQIDSARTYIQELLGELREAGEA